MSGLDPYSASRPKAGLLLACTPGASDTILPSRLLVFVTLEKSERSKGVGLGKPRGGEWPANAASDEGIIDASAHTISDADKSVGKQHRIWYRVDF